MVEAAPGATRPVNRKARTGTVVSDRGDQTIIVAIERAAPHRLYHKVIRSTRRYPVHDPENAASVGDLVRIEECRPISKTKRWRLVEIVQQREVAQVSAAAIDQSLVSEVQRSAARAEEEETGDTPETRPQPVAAAAPSGEGAEDAGGTAEVAPVAAPETETEAPASEADAAPETEAPTASEAAPEVASQAEAPDAPGEAAEAAGAGEEQTESEQQ
jgi:small subunit ribosomal protein S17